MSVAKLAEERHWNSWRSEYPAQMMHLPLRLTVTITAYSAAAASFTDFPAVKGDIAYGPRGITADNVRFSARHGGSAFDWRWDQPSGGALRGAWQATAFAEWGLRFWIMPVFEVEGRPDILWTFDEAAGLLSAEIDGQHVVVIGSQAPLMATFHADRSGLAAELAEHGYFYLGSRGVSGRVAVLRYNLDEMPAMQFAIGIGVDPASALADAKVALNAAPAPDLSNDPALGAIRDIVGWNSVHDFINDWPYMSLSRTWVAQKFGGFGLWLTDIFYHALGSGLLDAGLARENIRAVLATETPEGNLPCLITGRDQWIDRSQPPVCSFILWKIWKHTGAADLIELGYRKLLRAHDWWFARRDGAGRGMMSWGTSAGIGNGLYRSTKLGAKNESSMDNSPIHDEAVFDTATGCLDCFDVGLNALLVVDAEVLADWARSLGDAATADRLLTRAASLRKRIADQLWDKDRQIFANRRWAGDFVRAVAPTSFYPLLAAAADAGQQQGLLHALADPKKFGGQWRLPSVTRDDPAYHDNVYWRGRIWPPLNYLTYQGLKRAGFDAVASELADDSAAVFAASWSRRQCPENFSAETGLGDDQPDTDLFYGWGVLMPIIAVNEIIDVTPWHGWELNNRGADLHLGPLNAFGRRAEIDIARGRLNLRLDGRLVLASEIIGRLRHVEIAPNRISFEAPAIGGRIIVPGHVGGIGYGDLALEAMHQGEESIIDLPPRSEPTRCIIEVRP
ncbi:trehalase family glycosidase [Dongia sp.]|uniref:MGH1-like glycoside hydrolase domain-containing protein n=1 Tax=Dongia sp. TaxID=1977262 RepID=UPI0035B3DEA0